MGRRAGRCEQPHSSTSPTVQPVLASVEVSRETSGGLRMRNRWLHAADPHHRRNRWPISLERSSWGRSSSAPVHVAQRQAETYGRSERRAAFTFGGCSTRTSPSSPTTFADLPALEPGSWRAGAVRAADIFRAPPVEPVLASVDVSRETSRPLHSVSYVLRAYLPIAGAMRAAPPLHVAGRGAGARVFRCSCEASCGSGPEPSTTRTPLPIGLCRRHVSRSDPVA